MSRILPKLKKVANKNNLIILVRKKTEKENPTESNDMDFLFFCYFSIVGSYPQHGFVGLDTSVAIR